MRANKLSGLLKKGDRVAVSNITGREAAQVTAVSQKYCGNIVGGWALGHAGETLKVPGGEPVPVFGSCEELYRRLPPNRQPTKAVIYSPPEAVYGDVKEVIKHGSRELRTIFIITEHVSIEVTAKIRSICGDANVDVIGCNTLGAINAHHGVRVGAVGGTAPAECFRPGGVTIISNSGNMVNTIASYLLPCGIGTHCGISTGKDILIMTPLKELLQLAGRSEETELVVLYVEPGGRYEQEAIAWMRESDFDTPLVVYVAGTLTEKQNVSLGHAGAVVEGPQTSATGKMAAFDEYFGTGPFEPGMFNGGGGKKAEKGIRVTALHHIPEAAMGIYAARGLQRDFPASGKLRLNPWFVDFGTLAAVLPSRLLLSPGIIPEPYGYHFTKHAKSTLGLAPAPRDMRNASHASSLDASGQRVFGYPLTGLMSGGSFGRALILYWTGELPRHDFEARLVEMCLTGSLTNGPGTISAQAAKLSASAGNPPNTAMIAALAAMGDVHGGNGRRGVKFLLKNFAETDLADPYGAAPPVDPEQLAADFAADFRKRKEAAKEAGVTYMRIPCLGHPVFNDHDVNYDPREREIAAAVESAGGRNIFLDFYHHLARALFDEGVSRNVWAVNMDAAIAAVWLAICWRGLREKRLSVTRVQNCAFLGFALGRAAGGAGEYLDHDDHGSPMDMRIPPAECSSLTRPRDLPG